MNKQEELNMNLEKDECIEIVDKPSKPLKHTGKFDFYSIGQKYITLCGVEDTVITLYEPGQSPTTCEECTFKQIQINKK